MADNRSEQIEALEVLRDYNPKMVKALKEIVTEIKGERKDDTEVYLQHILKGVNWEIQVINGTLSLINEREEHISKEKFNDVIIRLNDTITFKNDVKLADIVEADLHPFLEKLNGIIEQVLA
ncbi:molecular chaperone [Lachnospiraceae bacterium ZAX-1]